jgi:hypothetical protein
VAAPTHLAFVAACAVATFFSAGAAHAADGSEVTTSAASHTGRIAGGRVTWESSYVANAGDDAPPSAPHRTHRIDLLSPVVAELDAARSPGVSVVRAPGDGHPVVAIEVDEERVPSWRANVTVVLEEPLTHDGADVVLAPPLCRGPAVQRLDVSGEGDLRFEPASSLGLVHDVGWWTSPAVTERARHDADGLLGERAASLDEQPFYLEADSGDLSRGLRGRLPTAAERARPGVLLAVVVSAFLILGCGAAYKRLAGDARVEQAEAALREEFAREAEDA